MPRIYNYIRGEGTVKNQRWGLGDVSTVQIGTDTLTQNDWQAVLNSLNGPQSGGPNMSTNYSDYSIYNTIPQNVLTPSIGQWIQSNAVLLLLGGVAGLMFFKR